MPQYIIYMGVDDNNVGLSAKLPTYGQLYMCVRGNNARPEFDGIAYDFTIAARRALVREDWCLQSPILLFFEVTSETQNLYMRYIYAPRRAVSLMQPFYSFLHRYTSLFVFDIQYRYFSIVSGAANIPKQSNHLILTILNHVSRNFSFF